MSCAMSRLLLSLLVLSCLLFSTMTAVPIDTDLRQLTKRSFQRAERRLYVGDKTKEEYKNDLSWIAYFPVEKLQGARYEWLSG